MDASLQPLLESLSTLEFEEFGSLTLLAATWEANDVTLHLTVHQQGQPDRPWLLHCREVRQSRIMIERGISNLQIMTQHPLLLPHTEAAVELYFSSRPSDADATVGRLVEAHWAAVGQWFDTTYFFNLGPEHSLRAMLNGAFGKLAEGPRSLIDSYADVLRASGVVVSSPPSRPPRWWDGTRWIEEAKPLFALILGGSHIVASAITAEVGTRDGNGFT